MWNVPISKGSEVDVLATESATKSVYTFEVKTGAAEIRNGADSGQFERYADEIGTGFTVLVVPDWAMSRRLWSCGGRSICDWALKNGLPSDWGLITVRTISLSTGKPIGMPVFDVCKQAKRKGGGDPEDYHLAQAAIAAAASRRAIGYRQRIDSLSAVIERSNSRFR